MTHRNLGRTGVKVSPLCLGCMMFGGRTDEAESMDIIDHAIDAGINFLDTANVYSRGNSEIVTGKALQRNAKRDQIVLATKVHGRMDDDDPNMQGNSRRHIIQQCEASLKRLQTDWIDLYQIHRPQPAIPVDETLRALDDLVRAGKVRYIGTSTFGAWQVVESLWVAERLGLNRFVTEQPPYHLLDRRIERELIPMAQTYGLGLIPWSPLAGGLLTDKYKRGDMSAEGRWQGGQQGNNQSRQATESVFDAKDKLEAMAKDKGCTQSPLALAWCMHQPGITSPIIGPRTMEQLKDNLGALEVEVADDDRAALDEVTQPGQMMVPYYQANFGPHEHRV